MNSEGDILEGVGMYVGALLLREAVMIVGGEATCLRLRFLISSVNKSNKPTERRRGNHFW